MADLNGPEHQRRRLSPRDAYGRVLMFWLIALVVAGGAFGTALAITAAGEATAIPERPIPLSMVLAATITVLGVVIPISIHWRLMHTYWRAGVVEPRGYVIAHGVLYGGYALTVVVLAVIALARPEAWICEFMAAVLPMLLLLLAWPTARVMYLPRTRAGEDSSDTLHMEEDDA